MSEITINKAAVVITEQTAREIMGEIANFKKEYPDRKVALIVSEFSKVGFLIHLETKPRTQESLGYHLDEKTEIE